MTHEKPDRDEQVTFISILGRAFRIMDRLLASDEPMGVTRLSAETGIPKANTFRILKTLEQLRAAEPMGDGYVLGPKLMEYACAAVRSNDFLNTAIPYLEELSRGCEESVTLGVLYREQILALHCEKPESGALISRFPPVTPLYCSSIGKQFLARRSNKEIRDYFKNERPQPRTVYTITSADAFLKEKQEILDSGIARDREEYDYGLSCLSAPIFCRDGVLAAGINISGPTSRLEFKTIEKLEARLKDTAEKLSKAVSGFDISAVGI